MLTIDTSDFRRFADKLERLQRQLPFAFSRALNNAARETRQYLIEDTWPITVAVTVIHCLLDRIEVPGTLRIGDDQRHAFTAEFLLLPVRILDIRE